MERITWNRNSKIELQSFNGKDTQVFTILGEKPIGDGASAICYFAKNASEIKGTLKEFYPEETTAEDIESMTVSEYTDNSSSTAEFTETEEIRDILKHSMMLVSSNWKDSTGVDYQYGISIALKQGEVSYFSLNFREGEIPAFVLKGLEENRVQNDDGEMMDAGFLP